MVKMGVQASRSRYYAQARGPGPTGPGPHLVVLVAYGFCGQMKVLQLALNVRELSPMNSVAE